MLYFTLSVTVQRSVTAHCPVNTARFPSLYSEASLHTGRHCAVERHCVMSSEHCPLYSDGASLYSDVPSLYTVQRRSSVQWSVTVHSQAMLHCTVSMTPLLPD